MTENDQRCKCGYRMRNDVCLGCSKADYACTCRPLRFIEIDVYIQIDKSLPPTCSTAYYTIVDIADMDKV